MTYHIEWTAAQGNVLLVFVGLILTTLLAICCHKIAEANGKFEPLFAWACALTVLVSFGLIIVPLLLLGGVK